jgi:hypothetical protein
MTMETILHKHKWFWGWDDDREETWLREMAQSGWHLKTVAPFGAYTFVSGPKQDIIYRLDFQPQAKAQTRLEYYQLFQDAGWEHVSEMASWQYFSKPANTAGPGEIFTDNASKVKKYQRLCGLLSIIMIVILTQFNNLSRAAERYDAWLFIPLVLYLAFLVVYIYAIIRLLMRIKQLSKPGNSLRQ